MSASTPGAPTAAALTPVASVIVPFFNSGRTIRLCLESLLAQEGLTGPIELIFIDNRSEDDSRTIVEEFVGERHPQLVLLSEDEPGAYAARNTGLERATGSVIAFTDADCAVAPDWLAAMLAELEPENVGAVVGHCRYPREASFLLRLLGAYENAKTQFVLERCPPSQWFAYANNLATRRALFDELGPFRTWRRAADSEWIHRLAKAHPDLRVLFSDTPRITHHEFLEAGARARRMSLYTETNQQIEGFQELRALQRLAIVGRVLRRGRA